MKLSFCVRDAGVSYSTVSVCASICGGGGQSTALHGLRESAGARRAVPPGLAAAVAHFLSAHAAAEAPSAAAAVQHGGGWALAAELGAAAVEAPRCG